MINSLHHEINNNNNNNNNLFVLSFFYNISIDRILRLIN